MDSGSVIFLFAAVIIVGALLFAVINFTRRGAAHLDVDRYRTRWLAIEQSLTREQPVSSHMAILNADKLVDQALKERGYGGQTMGERMKSAKQIWSNRNAIWEAHKLRNQIAHEPDANVTYESARRALAGFKQALKDLGAI